MFEEKLKCRTYDVDRDAQHTARTGVFSHRERTEVGRVEFHENGSDANHTLPQVAIRWFGFCFSIRCFLRSGEHSRPNACPGRQVILRIFFSVPSSDCQIEVSLQMFVLRCYFVGMGGSAMRQRLFSDSQCVIIYCHAHLSRLFKLV